MCGVIGIYKKNNSGMIGKEIYDGLLAIQHRGQDHAGILSFDGKEWQEKKRRGLVTNIFKEEDFGRLRGEIGIGHVRYTTFGSAEDKYAQPFFFEFPHMIGMEHNGNITNVGDIVEKFDKPVVGCDIKAMLIVIGEYLKSRESLGIEDVFNAVEYAMDAVEGSYSVIMAIPKVGLVGFRDPHGIRPLVMGKNEDGWMLSSETVALDVLGYEYCGVVKPGEVVVINSGVERKRIKTDIHTPCVFEWIYFARPDGMIEDIGVSKVRERLGISLGRKIKELGIEADIVIDAPSTAKHAAIALAEELKIPYRSGIHRNPYVGRSFITPTQETREWSVKHKLGVDREIVRGKSVIVVDDSIVRGHTSKKIINLLKEAGARKTYFVSTAPPIKHVCVYGIDMAIRNELLAVNKTYRDIADFLGCDDVIYQRLEELPEIVGLENICDACFSGTYPTGISREEIDKIERERINSRKR